MARSNNRLSYNRLLISALPVALFGCNLAGDGLGGSAAANDVATIEEVVALDPERPDADARIVDEGEYIDFSYGWPDAAEQQPALAGYLRGKATDWLAEVRGMMAGDERLSDPDADLKPEYTSETRWSVVGTSGPLTSLSSSFYHYTGGAHGIYGTDALLFDSAAGDVVQPADIFADRDAAREAIQGIYCDLLDAERSRRRGGELPTEDDYGFWDCIDPLEQTLIFHAGESMDGAFDRLIVYAGPYAAGAYAEGDFTIELPVNAALIAAIRPEYRQYFAVDTGPAITEQPGE